MARKTQISQDVILQAAFHMLIRDGYASINITSLSKEIGCSTQPIVWHFGSMDGLRAELLNYCLNFLKDRFVVNGTNVVEILEHIAEEYIDIALQYPNLYKYLYISDRDGLKMEELTWKRRFEKNEEMIKMVQAEYHVSSAAARRYLMDLQIYVHGMASFVVTTPPISSKSELIKMIHRANKAFWQHMKEERE